MKFELNYYHWVSQYLVVSMVLQDTTYRYAGMNNYRALAFNKVIYSCIYVTIMVIPIK